MASGIPGPVRVVTEPLDARTEGHREHSVLKAVDCVHASPAAGEGNKESLPSSVRISASMNTFPLWRERERKERKVYNLHFQASPKVTLKFT